MSRWTRPFSWACCKPSAAWRIREQAVLSQAQRLRFAGAHLARLKGGQHAFLDEEVGDALRSVALAEPARGPFQLRVAQQPAPPQALKEGGTIHIYPPGVRSP